MNFKQYIKENPDGTINPKDETKELKHNASDAYTFGYFKGKLFVENTQDIYHIDMYNDLNPNNQIDDADDARELLYPAGRIWSKSKVISFWGKIPEKQTLIKVLNDLHKKKLFDKNNVQNWFIDLQVTDRDMTEPNIVNLMDYLNGKINKIKKSKIKYNPIETVHKKALSFLHVKTGSAREKLINDFINGTVPQEIFSLIPEVVKQLTTEDIKKIGAQLESEIGERKSDTNKMKKASEKQGFKTETELRQKMYVGDNTKILFKEVIK